MQLVAARIQPFCAVLGNMSQMQMFFSSQDTYAILAAWSYFARIAGSM